MQGFEDIQKKFIELQTKYQSIGAYDGEVSSVWKVYLKKALNNKYFDLKLNEVDWELYDYSTSDFNYEEMKTLRDAAIVELNALLLEGVTFCKKLCGDLDVIKRSLDISVRFL